MSLRINQRKAVATSEKNNFASGVHFHATGTGKSWIALEIILKFNHLNPKKNILWLCEQKSILIEQFNKATIKEKGYGKIFNKFMVINFTQRKPTDWYKQISSALFWGKPLLIVINRSFLVSRQKYKKMKILIDLVIHDECHSITNKTTRDFYNYMLERNKKISCLGFSATPKLEYKPGK